MGLAASQVRLLSLTSRQHSIEGEAHRLQANKLRLSNDSDTAYMKYLNALDDTFLKTRQVKNDTGAASWIDASINNLLRYQTSDETTGQVFYVQDIGTGKLYIPTEIGNKFDSSTGMREFVMACDPSIEYEEVNEAKHIEQQYLKYLDLGYDKVLASTTDVSDKLVAEYYSTKVKDENTVGVAKNAVDTIPYVSAFGNHILNSSDRGKGSSFINALKEVKSKAEYNTTYTYEEKAIIEGALSLINHIGKNYPSDTITENTSSVTTITYSPSKIISRANNENYTSFENEYGDDELFLSMLNGGYLTWQGKETTKIVYNDGTTPSVKYTTDYSKTVDIYDTDIVINGNTVKAKDVLKNYSNANTFGSALISVLRRVSTSPSPLQTFLNSNGITEDDVKHYQEYKRAAANYKSYMPVIVWKSNNPVKAAYYEEIYNAITAAGGWIGADESKAKNGTWVSNMVKNAQVIITDWDPENEILTNTTTALVTNINEVTDQNYIEKVSQEYEDTLNEINVKDTRFDKRLAQLETEREAIVTEVDGLKEVMKNNVEKTFKVFG